jgi:hypothetical protein
VLDGFVGEREIGGNYFFRLAVLTGTRCSIGANIGHGSFPALSRTRAFSARVWSVSAIIKIHYCFYCCFCRAVLNFVFMSIALGVRRVGTLSRGRRCSPDRYLDADRVMARALDMMPVRPGGGLARCWRGCPRAAPGRAAGADRREPRLVEPCPRARPGCAGGGRCPRAWFGCDVGADRGRALCLGNRRHWQEPCRFMLRHGPVSREANAVRAAGADCHGPRLVEPIRSRHAPTALIVSQGHPPMVRFGRIKETVSYK